jgi:hypothetical protein
MVLRFGSRRRGERVGRSIWTLEITSSEGQPGEEQRKSKSKRAGFRKLYKLR